GKICGTATGTDNCGAPRTVTSCGVCDPWTPATTGIYGGTVLTVAVDPTTPSTMYLGTFNGGVFKSTNGGTSWAPASAGLTNLQVAKLAIDPLTPSTLYAATHDGVFKTTDGGANWASSGLTGFSILAVAVDPKTPATLYAGTDISSTGG